MELHIPKLACATCVANVTKAIQALDSGAVVSGEPKTKQVSIQTQASELAVREALTAAGYPPS